MQYVKYSRFKIILCKYIWLTYLLKVCQVDISRNSNLAVAEIELEEVNKKKKKKKIPTKKNSKICLDRINNWTGILYFVLGIF